MSEVEIEYCVPCRYLPMAEETSHALLESFGQRIRILALRPGHGGVFRLRVGEDVVFDARHDQYDVAEIVRRVGARLDTAAVE